MEARIRGSKPVGPGLNQDETNFENLGPDQHQKFEIPGSILAVRESLSGGFNVERMKWGLYKLSKSVRQNMA